MTGADSATLLIAAATSYKNFKDVSGDPEALAKDYLAAASRKSFDALAPGPRRRAPAAVPPRVRWTSAPPTR